MILTGLAGLVVLGVFAAIRLAQAPSSGWSAGWSGLVFAGAVAAWLFVTLLRFWVKPAAERQAALAEMSVAQGTPTSSQAARRHLVMTTLRDRPSWTFDTTSMAQVVCVASAGMAREQHERVYLELDVTVGNTTRRVATGDQLTVAELTQLTVGSTVPVRYDSSEPARLALDLSRSSHT